MKDVSLIVYTTTDMAATKAFFRELIGTDPYVDSPQYVGYKSGEIEIGLVSGAASGGMSALAYWSVDDIAASVKALESVGGAVAQAIRDVGYGLLVASVKEPGGATIGLRQFPKS